jgi:hypothetical protein
MMECAIINFGEFSIVMEVRYYAQIVNIPATAMTHVNHHLAQAIFLILARLVNQHSEHFQRFTFLLRFESNTRSLFQH